MTIDERIEKTQTLLAKVVDGIKRLERIALSRRPDIDDIERCLDDLEARRRKKPQ
jgi:hypothetical protein